MLVVRKAGTILWSSSHQHGTLDLLCELLFHLGLSRALLGRIEDTHGLEVQSADTPHEYLFQILLHNVPISILNNIVLLAFIQFSS